MIPDWLQILSFISLISGAISALVIAWDEAKDPQHMWIMNVVWPVVALFGSVIALWAYFSYGKLAAHNKMHPAMEKGETPPNKKYTPFPMMVAKGTSHCGSGCTLGDIIAEWLLFFVPVIATWFGWKTLFADKIFAAWMVDYFFALVIGVAFQYFTIKPMRDLSVKEGIIQAIKADVLSLTSWQIGMYGFMAIAHFWIFADLLGTKLEVNSVEFWFMMQIAMWCGFVTAYPVNWWLIEKGVKEKM